ncbi:MAG: MoaD/ThiS family protein [Pyrinomonadaceae bacterium]
MKVKVLFFGATADAAGRRSIEIDVPEASTSGSAFERVVGQYPALASHKLLFSVNQEYAAGDETLRPGDELAVFTAVSGG